MVGGSREPDRPRSQVSGGTDEQADPRERPGPRRRGDVREPVVRQPAGSSLRAGRGRLVRGRDRQAAVESGAGVGRAPAAGRDRLLRRGDRHEHAEPRSGRGTPARQHPVVRAPRQGEPLQAGCGEVRQRSPRRPAADDGRFRRRLHQHVDRRARPPAQGRGVLPDHGRLHAGPDARAVDDRAGFRDVRPLVLRRADVHLSQPLLLPRRVVVRARRQHVAAGLVPAHQRRGDTLRPARRGRPDVEGLLRPAVALLADRAHPRPTTRSSLRHQLLLDATVLRRRRGGDPADLLVHRATDHRLEPQRHAPAVRRGGRRHWARSSAPPTPRPCTSTRRRR